MKHKKPNPKIYRVENLCSYMKSRAKHEGVEWGLTKESIEYVFKKGARNFFGVELDDQGELLSDNQQPEFFERYNQVERKN